MLFERATPDSDNCSSTVTAGWGKTVAKVRAILKREWERPPYHTMSEEPRWAAVILAAGYGSRLQKDIEADASREFDHLLGQPKGLLPVGGVPLLDHWLRAFRASADRVGPVIVVTNELFHRQFTEWAVSRGLGRDAVVNDGTTTNEQRLGACGDLELALRERAELIGDRDVLVVAGDTLFFQDFELGAFLDALPPRRSGVVTYQIGSDAETRKRGIVELEPDGRVAALLEKPEPSATSSRAACPAFYAYRHACKALIRRFLAEHAHAPLECKDAPGQLLAWLLRAGHEVQAVPISGRFDIGSLRAGAGAERSGGAGEGERRRSAEGPAGHRGPAAGGGIWAGQRAAQAVAPERRAAA